jgi:hypothetical protein
MKYTKCHEKQEDNVWRVIFTKTTIGVLYLRSTLFGVLYLQFSQEGVIRVFFPDQEGTLLALAFVEGKKHELFYNLLKSVLILLVTSVALKDC